MPKAFDDCVKSGGRVRTLSGPSKKFGLDKGQYMRICFRKDGGAVRGHVQTKSAEGAERQEKRQSERQS